MKGSSKIYRPVSLIALAGCGIWMCTFVKPVFADDHVTTIIATKPAETAIDSSFEQCMLQHFEKRFFKRIDATDEQKGKLSTILSSRVEATRPLREKLRHELLAMTDLMAKDDATSEQIKRQQEVIKGIRDQLADERLKSTLQAREVLTPAQRQLIADKVRGFLSGDIKPHRLMGSSFPAKVLIGQLVSDN